MRMIDRSPIQIRDSYSLTEAINNKLISINNPDLLSLFEKNFQIRPQLMLSVAEDFSKNEISQNSYGHEQSREKLFEVVFPSFFCAQEDENCDMAICIRVDGEYFVTYLLKDNTLTVLSEENHKADLLVDTSFEAFSCYVRHKLYNGATLINQGLSEEEVFSQPVGLIELTGEQMELVGGGITGCGWACAGDFSTPTLGGTFGAGNPDLPPTPDPGCTTNGCGSQSSGPCNVDGCGVDNCGANACAGDTGGGDACGADACAADACGGDACAANACAGDICGGDACGANACGADACSIDACGVNACAAQGCWIDFIPGVPGI